MIEEVFGQPLCIEASYLQAMAMTAYSAFSSNKPLAGIRYEAAYAINPHSGLKQAGNYNKGSVGIVVIDGPIVQTSDYWNGIKGTVEAAQELQLLDADPNIIGTVLYLNTGGGAVYAIKPITDVLSTLTKPVVTFSKTILASAGYYIAAYTSHIMMYHPQGIVGSIGTMISMSDMQPMFEKWGMKFFDYYATASSLKNKTFTDAQNGDPKAIRAFMLDPMNEQFLADIKRLRGKKIDSKTASIYQGETFLASPQGLSLGLLDSTGTLKDAVQKVVELSESGVVAETDDVEDPEPNPVTDPDTDPSNTLIKSPNMKTDAIAALAGKTDPTQDELDKANANLTEAGITGVSLMPDSLVDAAAQATIDNDTLTTANATLQTNLDLATTSVTKLTADNALLKAKLAKGPAAVAPVTGATDVSTEPTAEEKMQAEMDALPHNQAVAGNPLFN